MLFQKSLVVITLGNCLDESSLFEIGVFYLSQYRKLDGCITKKENYIRARDEFIEKFKVKYLQVSAEILKFFQMHLLYKPAENNYDKSDLLIDEGILINRIC